MNNIKNLKPEALWNNFANLSAVPRPSKKEDKVIQFIKEFGENLSLETIVDEVGNVIIKKSAFKGMEDRTTVVLQGHLDMVPQKNADIQHDFEKDGIDMYIDEDWVKAKGTTLGADNGMGVAAAMTILESTDIPHPPIEALFTINEESGMTGARGLKEGLLNGKILLNLDSEEDDELTIGCAGGIDITTSGNYNEETAQNHFKGYKLSIKGLNGGHSGMQIHLGRGNSNKLMNRILFTASEKCNLRISSIDGGGLRNAIPRESFATVLVPENNIESFKTNINDIINILKDEYQTTDPELEILLENIETPKKVIDIDFQNKFLNAIYGCPNGIYRLSPDMEDLTQTSNNLARVVLKDGKYSVQCLTRSSIETEKIDIAQSIVSTFALAGIEMKLSNSYPGWIPKPEAPIVNTMSNIYSKLFNEDVKIVAGHGGLECGIIGKNYPEMDMISFGPTITGPHSPDEQVQISSVQKFWLYLLEVLKRM